MAAKADVVGKLLLEIAQQKLPVLGRQESREENPEETWRARHYRSRSGASPASIPRRERSECRSERWPAAEIL